MDNKLVKHRPDCDLESQGPFMISHVDKYKWCPRCGVPANQVVVDPSSLDRKSIAYPTIILFRDINTGKSYRYYLRSSLAKIEDIQADITVWIGADTNHDGDISVKDWVDGLADATDYKFVVGRPAVPQDSCEYCGGTGKTELVSNSAYHYEPGEDPDIVEDVCDECGGTGKKLVSD